MTAIGPDHLLLKFCLYQMHKSIGLLVLAGALVRLTLLARRGRPALPAIFAPAERTMIFLGHAALYGLLLLVPVLGYLNNSTSPSRIPVLFMMVIPLPNLTSPSKGWNDVLSAWHERAAFVLLATASIHALLAIKHHSRGLPILRRMWSG